VSEQFLYHSEVGTPVEEMGCEAVPQRVRVRRRRRSAVEEAPDVSWAQAPSTTVEKHGIAGTVSPDQALAAPADPCLHGGGGRRADRDLSLLGTFSPHRDQPAVRINVTKAQSAKLGHPEAGAVQQLEHGVVSETHGKGVVSHPGGGMVEEGVEIA
jgi:hypothetical protein